VSLILIVDDVPAMSEQYAYDLKRLGGYETRTTSEGTAALKVLESEPVDCVLLDLEMPAMDGFGVLEAMRERGVTVPVIVYTGTGNYERCVRAVKLGAYSFLDKSESMEKVAREVENALERTRLAAEVRALRLRLGESGHLLGESKAMQTLRETIARVAPVPSPVLILGESGTGKELVAREIHARSGRARAPFLPVNCAALPETLVESELFGHERGAFTGASAMKKGAFEAAHRGTLFLDEIGELPLPAQAALLRVLEDNRVTRVGGTKAVEVDTRVVAATNRDLETEVAARRFRQDLLFRLNVHVVTVPPLRSRLSDVPLLVQHFLDTVADRMGARPKSMSGDAMKRLTAYGWERNNVRELRNIVERMVLATDEGEIGVGAVPVEIRNPGSGWGAWGGVSAGASGGASGGVFGGGASGGASGEAPGSPHGQPVGSGGGDVLRTLKERRAAAECAILLDALARNDWQINRTAAELGLADHSSLLKIMRRHGIKRS
jgi:two-component system nitrogen regulation response regulator NtrX